MVYFFEREHFIWIPGYIIGYVCRVSRRVLRLDIRLQPDHGSAAVVEAGAANNGRPCIDPHDPMQGQP